MARSVFIRLPVAAMLMTGLGCRARVVEPTETEAIIPISKVAELFDQAVGACSLSTVAPAKGSVAPRLEFAMGAFSPKRFEFDLPEKKIDLGYAGAIVYRLNSLKMATCHCKEEGGDLVFAATLKSDGPTLKGSHSALGNRLVPDVLMKNMVLTIRITPAVDKNGRPIYQNPRASFTSDVLSSLGELSIGTEHVDLLDEVTGYRKSICQGIGDEITKSLRSPELQTSIAKQLWTSLKALTANYNAKILSCAIDGSNLRVRLVDNVPSPRSNGG